MAYLEHTLKLSLAGSLFNHSSTPNVSYTLDHETESIRYTTSRIVTKDEELCIFYGHKLWFQDADGPSHSVATADDSIDPLAGLPLMDYEDQVPSGEMSRPSELLFLEGDPDEIIPEAQLPFTRLKLVDDEEEDEIEHVRLGTIAALFVARLQSDRFRRPSRESLGC